MDETKNRSSENHPTASGFLPLKGVPYLNASLIEHNGTTYIATQHPLQDSIVDFWKMILIEKPSVILMLNGYEFFKEKEMMNSNESLVSVDHPYEELYPQYWAVEGSSLTIKDAATGMSVCVSQTGEVELLDGVGFASQLKVTISHNALRKSLEGGAEKTESTGKLDENSGSSDDLEYCDKDSECSDENSWTCWHVCCTFWKDQTAPDPKMFVSLWRTVAQKILDKSKLVVHCTGGIGRTGTYIAVDIAAREMRKNEMGSVSIDEIILKLRKKRMNMVGHHTQYAFCHSSPLQIFDQTKSAV